MKEKMEKNKKQLLTLETVRPLSLVFIPIHR